MNNFLLFILLLILIAAIVAVVFLILFSEPLTENKANAERFGIEEKKKQSAQLTKTELELIERFHELFSDEEIAEFKKLDDELKRMLKN